MVAGAHDGDARSCREGVKMKSDYNFPKVRFCRRGHAIIGDNIHIYSPRGCRYIQCRTCRIEHRKRHLKTRLPSAKKMGEVVSALHEGKTITEIVGFKAHRYTPGTMVIDRRYLNNFFEENPKIKKRLLRMSAKNAAVLRQERFALIARPAIIRDIDDIMDTIRAAVPMYLPRDHRDDVIQNIWLAVIERRLNWSEIASRAREFIRAEYRTSHNAWGPRSLDVPIWIDGNTTLLDTLTRGLWD
jgi:hypothetical protein